MCSCSRIVCWYMLLWPLHPMVPLHPAKIELFKKKFKIQNIRSRSFEMTDFISLWDSCRWCRIINWALSIYHFVCRRIYCPHLESAAISSKQWGGYGIFANIEDANIVYHFDQKMCTAFEQLLLKIIRESYKFFQVHSSSKLTVKQSKKGWYILL